MKYPSNHPLHIENERVVWVDVDGTLVVHEALDKDKTVEVPDQITGGILLVCPHKPNIRIVKEEFVRGAYVIVHSKGGHQWAMDVVVALGLSPYVHQVLTKPAAYIDDLDAADWMPDRTFLPHNVPYKE